MNKFEKLVEFILNEEEEQAQDLFHEIVVEKSREIYNELSMNESEDQTDDFVSDIEADELGDDMHTDDDMDDDMDMDDNEDMDMDDEDMDDDTEELEDRVVDLEAELDALKAEFDAMMSDSDGDGDIDGHEHDMDDDEEEVEEELDMFEDDDEDDEDMDEDMVREYTEKVGGDQYHKFGKMGDNGANAKSVVAGKNDMGGTTSNIVKGGTATGGKAKAPKDMNTGNINVPGGKAGNAFSKNTNQVKKMNESISDDPRYMERIELAASVFSALVKQTSGERYEVLANRVLANVFDLESEDEIEELRSDFDHYVERSTV